MLRKIGLPNLVLILVICGALFSRMAAQPPQPQAPSVSQSNEGIKLISEGRFTEAVAVFSRIKLTSPQDARPYFYSGMALAEAGRLTAAALELGEAVRLDPHHPEYLILQANVFARLKQKSHVDDALAIFQKAGAAEKLEASWLWLLVDAYYRVERFDDALRALELMEKRFPDDP